MLSTELGSVVIARFVVVAFVEVEFTVMKFVDVRFVIVATAAVRESAIALVKRASVEKNEVVVAFVMVAFAPFKLATVDEPNAMRPFENVRRVDVAPFVNASCIVTPELSVPQIRTPAAVAFTSQDAALSEETVRFVVEAFVDEMFVVVAFAATMFPKVLVPVKVLVSPRSVDDAAFTVILLVPSNATPLMFRAVSSAVAVPAFPEISPVMVWLKVLFPVKVLSLYVFAIVVEASAKCVAEVVENAAPWF